MSEPMNWWGWGPPEGDISTALFDLLRIELGISGEITPQPPPLDDIKIAKTNVNPELRAALQAIAGENGVRIDPAERIRHARGRSYTDLIDLRRNSLHAPDAVIYPRDADQVAAILQLCREHDCVVIPFGGGTSVVGGVNPDPTVKKTVLCLDLGLLAGVVAIDTESLTATVRAGTRATDFEQELGRRGFTLGHFPQSYEYATMGGFAATRSAGQASSGYGRFDQMVIGLRCTTPEGEVVVAPHPSTAAGPSLLQLLLGSEGTLGVITEVTVRVHRKSAVAHYEGWAFPTFVDGLQAFRALAQSGMTPDVIRLSDEEESRVAMASSQTGAALRALGDAYLRMHGQSHGCIAILGWDRDTQAQTARREAASRIAGRGGGVPLGSGPGKSWLRNRYQAPYLRDALLDRGVLAETLETATSWSNLTRVWRRVRDALTTSLDEQGTHPIVGAHASHVYPTGACLYFTVLAKQSGDPTAQWLAAKRAATDAIIDAGATLTHHHGVGRDHAAWMEREIGSTGTEALRAVKRRLDPGGIMNPGIGVSATPS